MNSSSATVHSNLPLSSNSRVRDIYSPTPISSFLFNDHLSSVSGEERVELSSLPLLRRLSLEQQSHQREEEGERVQQYQQQQQPQQYDDDSQQSGVTLPHVSTGCLSPVDGDIVSDRDQWLLQCTCRYQKVV